MKAASSNENIEENSVRKFEDLWGDHPCDHIYNEDPAFMITYPYRGLDKYRTMRVARFPGRKVVLTFYLVSDTYADLKFSG